MAAELVGGYREDGSRLGIEHDGEDHMEQVIVTILHHRQPVGYVLIPERKAITVLREAADNIEQRIKERENKA